MAFEIYREENYVETGHRTLRVDEDFLAKFNENFFSVAYDENGEKLTPETFKPFTEEDIHRAFFGDVDATPNEQKVYFKKMSGFRWEFVDDYIMDEVSDWISDHCEFEYEDSYAGDWSDYYVEVNDEGENNE